MKNTFRKILICLLAVTLLSSVFATFAVSAEETQSTEEVSKVDLLYNFDQNTSYTYKWNTREERFEAKFNDNELMLTTREDKATGNQSIRAASTPNGTVGLLWDSKTTKGDWLELIDTKIMANLGCDFSISYDVYFEDISDEAAIRLGGVGGAYTYSQLFIMEGKSVYAMSRWEKTGNPLFTVEMNTWYTFEIRYSLADGIATFLVNGVEKGTSTFVDVVSGYTNLIRIQLGGVAKFYFDNLHFKTADQYWSHTFSIDTPATYQNDYGMAVTAQVQVFNNFDYGGKRAFSLVTDDGRNVLQFDNSGTSNEKVNDQRAEFVRNIKFMHALTPKMTFSYQIKFEALGTETGKESLIKLAGNNTFANPDGFALVGDKIYRYNGKELDLTSLYTVECGKWYTFTFTFDTSEKTMEMAVDGTSVGSVTGLLLNEDDGTCITMGMGTMDPDLTGGRCKFLLKDPIACKIVPVQQEIPGGNGEQSTEKSTEKSTTSGKTGKSTEASTKNSPVVETGTIATEEEPSGGCRSAVSGAAIVVFVSAIAGGALALKKKKPD